jgi:hypothetical protein
LFLLLNRPSKQRPAIQKHIPPPKMAIDRFEIYTRLMGGEENLPPRLATPPPTTDAFGNLQTYDDFVSAHPFPAPPAPAYDNRHAPKTQSNGAATRRSEGKASETDVDIDFTLDPRRGGPSELGMSFCPFLAVTKFPYKYVASDYRQPIATAFFDENKVYNRSWDL